MKLKAVLYCWFIEFRKTLSLRFGYAVTRPLWWHRKTAKQREGELMELESIRRGREAAKAERKRRAALTPAQRLAEDRAHNRRARADWDSLCQPGEHAYVWRTLRAVFEPMTLRPEPPQPPQYINL